MLPDVEQAVLIECLAYFWEDSSGIQTYDAMPPNWPAFVEAASTALGFGANMKGLTEIIHGWQQERRDLCSKLTNLTSQDVELRHFAGLRLTEGDRFKADKQRLAEDYTLSARYFFKAAKATLRVRADLRSKLISVALDINPPAGKAAKAAVRWVAATLDGDEPSALSVSFDWPGRGTGSTDFASRLRDDPDRLADGQKSAPKMIHFILTCENSRGFKSRKKFIELLEYTTLHMMKMAFDRGWLR